MGLDSSRPPEHVTHLHAHGCIQARRCSLASHGHGPCHHGHTITWRTSVPHAPCSIAFSDLQFMAFLLTACAAYAWDATLTHCQHAAQPYLEPALESTGTCLYPPPFSLVCRAPRVPTALPFTTSMHSSARIKPVEGLRLEGQRETATMAHMHSSAHLRLTLNPQPSQPCMPP